MKKNNKVTEDIDIVGSKHTVNIKAIISFVMMFTVFIIGFNYRINKANYLEPVVEEVMVSVTTTENMTTTSTMASTMVSSSIVTTSSCITTSCTTVVTTEEVTTTTEDDTFTIPVNIQVVYDEPVHEDPSPEPIIETEPIVDVVEESSTEESSEPPIVEEPVAVEETEPVSMTYLGSLKITGYVATGNPTASGVYPYVGGVAMSRSYGLSWGTTIYIDGLGYYTLFDTGCSYGVVDVFCDSIQECYDLTSWRDVYVVN